MIKWIKYYVKDLHMQLKKNFGPNVLFFISDLPGIPAVPLDKLTVKNYLLLKFKFEIQIIQNHKN